VHDQCVAVTRRLEIRRPAQIMASYDTAKCAQKCNAISGCASFNLYYERDLRLIDPAYPAVPFQCKICRPLVYRNMDMPFLCSLGSITQRPKHVFGPAPTSHNTSLYLYTSDSLSPVAYLPSHSPFARFDPSNQPTSSATVLKPCLTKFQIKPQQ
jgi:hypothetical protein